jgi:hypothetical protein
VVRGAGQVLTDLTSSFYFQILFACLGVKNYAIIVVAMEAHTMSSAAAAGKTEEPIDTKKPMYSYDFVQWLLNRLTINARYTGAVLGTIQLMRDNTLDKAQAIVLLETATELQETQLREGMKEYEDGSVSSQSQG